MVIFIHFVARSNAFLNGNGGGADTTEFIFLLQQLVAGVHSVICSSACSCTTCACGLVQRTDRKRFAKVLGPARLLCDLSLML